MEDRCTCEALDKINILTVEILDAISPVIDGKESFLITAALANIIQAANTLNYQESLDDEFQAETH